MTCMHGHADEAVNGPGGPGHAKSYQYEKLVESISNDKLVINADLTHLIVLAIGRMPVMVLQGVGQYASPVLILDV